MHYEIYDIGSQKLVSIVEVANIRTYSRKLHKLQNIYHVRKEHLHLKNGNNCFNIKIICFIVTFRRNYDICYEQVKVQNGGLQHQKNMAYLTEVLLDIFELHLFKNLVSHLGI